MIAMLSVARYFCQLFWVSLAAMVVISAAYYVAFCGWRVVFYGWFC